MLIKLLEVKHALKVFLYQSFLVITISIKIGEIEIIDILISIHFNFQCQTKYLIKKTNSNKCAVRFAVKLVQFY